ncbi:Hypothetical protein R9X50_00726500 [Acrodontium crateriforme]|uniref:Cupin type-1 domain-containing protein n=1 Tax=Acrodontium crateriforme TaxID=150365 RepID=A0AAQ3MAL4_9PEZI|nr:Hypothetical protein R9X50_00726500 [Acrodontium crateriforme]
MFHIVKNSRRPITFIRYSTRQVPPCSRITFVWITIFLHLSLMAFALAQGNLLGVVRWRSPCLTADWCSGCSVYNGTRLRFRPKADDEYKNIANLSPINFATSYYLSPLFENRPTFVNTISTTTIKEHKFHLTMHVSKFIMAGIGSTSTLAAPASPAVTKENSINKLELIHALQLAPTAVDRVNLLDAGDWVYDFNAPPANATTSGKGGHTVKADRKTFPALIGTGVSMTVGFIGPCGFNTPHVHPRSSEINVIVQGRLATEFVAENGAKPISNYLEKFQMTVFPQGATHTEFNPDCDDAIFVAGFANEDPGVEQIAQTLFELDPAVVRADLGLQAINGEQIEAFRQSLPANVALGVDSCLKKCGIHRRQSSPKA